MIPLGIAPGPNSPYDIASFLKPFLDEITMLSSRGIRITKGGIDVYCGKVFLLGVTGDIPAIATVMGHSGHMSTYGCKLCKVVGVSPPGGRGKYFPSVGAMRTKRELLSEITVSNLSDIKPQTLTPLTIAPWYARYSCLNW